MYYEINVAKKSKSGGYSHFFATAKRSIKDTDVLASVLETILVAYPEPEYSVSVSKYEERGYRVDCRPFTQTPEVITNKQLVELVILTLNKGDIWKLTIKVTKKQVQAIKRFIAYGQDETRTISSVTKEEVIEAIEEEIYYQIEMERGTFNPNSY